MALTSPFKPIFKLGRLKTDIVVFWDQSFPIFLCNASSMAVLCAECLHKMRGGKPNSKHLKPLKNLMQAQRFLCNYSGLLLKKSNVFSCIFLPLKVPGDDFVKMQLPLQGLCPCPLLLGNVIYVDPGGCCISVISFERIGLISLRSEPPFPYLCRGLKLCGLCK